MKKIIFISLLLISKFCCSQIVVTVTSTFGYTPSSAGIGSVSSQTYTAGRLYICIYMRLDDAGVPDDFTLTGTNSTWTEISNTTGITTGAARARLKVWRYMPTVNVTEALSFSGGAFAEGTYATMWEITGVKTGGTNGSEAIVQIVTGSADAGANPSITMAALTGSENTVVGFFGNDANPFGSTPESGWTELHENGFTLPTTGGVFIKRDLTTDNTPSVTAAASNWMGVVIELSKAVDCKGAHLALGHIIIGGSFSTTGVTGANWTKNANTLYILITGTSNISGTPATCNPTGTGETWTEIGSAGGVVHNNRRIQAFRFFATTTTTGVSTFLNYSGTQDGGFMEVYTVNGGDFTGTNGANAIVQVVTATDNATIQPSITMSALRHNSGVIAAWINDVNPPAGTADAGWTEGTDNGYATPDTGGYIIISTGHNTADNTPSWTAGALSNWAGIAIEFKASCRRSVLID